MVRIRRLEVVAPADDRQRRRKRIRRAGDGGERIRQRDRRRRVELDQRRERRRQHAALEEVALSGERIVEHAEGGADTRAPVALRIPRDRQARRDVVLVGRHHAARHIGIAGIDEPAGRGRIFLRLDSGAEPGDRVVHIDERRRQLVAHAEIQRQPRRDAELILRVAGKQPAVALLDRLLRRRARLRREAEQEIGGGIAAEAAAERQIAVRAIDERDPHRLAPDIDAELHRVAAGDPGHVVGELPHVIDAIDKRLLRVAQGRIAAAEETADHDRRQAGGDRVGVREVDAVAARAQAAGDRGVGADAIHREPRLVDDARADHEVVRDQPVLQRRERALIDRRDDLRRQAIGVAAHVASEHRLAGAELVVEAHAELIAGVVHRRRCDVAIAGGVGQRHEIPQQLRGRGADASRRDDVAVKRQAGQRIANRRAAGKISVALRRREHQDVLRDAAVVPVALVIAEPKQPVLEQRTADARRQTDSV